MSRIILTDFQAGVRLYGVVQTNTDEYTQTNYYADYLALLDEQPTANGEFDGSILATSATISGPDTNILIDVTFEPVNPCNCAGTLTTDSNATAEAIANLTGIGQNIYSLTKIDYSYLLERVTKQFRGLE